MMQNEYLSKQLSEAEENLKKERRKAASFERELEQSNFSVQTVEKNLSEEIKAYKETISHFKQEITLLESRLQISVRESQNKLKNEQNKCQQLIQELRNKDNVVEDL